MRLLITILSVWLFGITGLWAQFPSARIQTIHTIIDPTVDVWIYNPFFGDSLVSDNFVFRTASPFLDVPAGIGLEIGVAPENSTSYFESIFNVSQAFTAGRLYCAFVKGDINDLSSLEYILDENARETAVNPSLVDISMFHASPDAPAVDIAVQNGPTLFSNVSYGQFTPYASVAPGAYVVDVKPAGTNDVVASYKADLSGLQGGAVRIFASGYLSGQSPAFAVFAALANGTVVELEQFDPLARVQIIHNSADPTVDIYVNGDRLLDDFTYRTATPFIDVPAGVVLNIGVAPANSTSVNDTLVNFPVILTGGNTYVVAASGIVGDPITPFTLLVNDLGQEASTDPDKVQLSVLHGATDAPAVDVDALGAGNLVTDLSYGSFTPYISVDPGAYRLRIKPAGTNTVVARYLADLNGLAGGAACVFASGKLAGNPDFGLFAALPDGSVIELPTYDPEARLQVIHNSADPTVDVYANGGLLLDNFAYRTATPFITVAAETPINLGVALSNSTSVNDTLVNFTVSFDEGKTYIVTASGVVGNTTTPFTLIANDMGREVSTDTSRVQFAVLHGSTDAPAVDVDALGAGNLVTDLAYGQFTPYLSVPAAAYRIRVKPAGTNTVVARYLADLSGLKGGAAYVFASGTLAGSPDFGLFAALANGTVLELPTYDPEARLQVIHNSPSPTVDVYANGGLLLDNFVYRTATPFITAAAETPINLGVALDNSTSVNDTLVNFTVTLEEGKTYVVTASGIVGDLQTPFTLIADDQGRELASNPARVDINVLHGSTNAPAVDVDELLTGNVVENLAYGESTGYITLTPGVYDFGIRAAGTSGLVAAYRADLSSLAGGAAYVFASGLLGGDPAFGLYAALPNGAVLELPSTPLANVQIIHNSASPTVDVYAGQVRLIDDFAYRTATPYVLVPANRDFSVGVAADNSASASDALATFPVNFAAGQTYTVFAGGLLGNVNTPFTLFVDNSRTAATDPQLVDFAVHHGVADAPAVDVDAFGVGTLVNNLGYGEFTPFLSVGPDAYVLVVRPAGQPNVVGAYLADLTGLQGGAARVFASGLLAGDPDFGLFAALPDGTVVEFPEFTLPASARVQIIHNSPTPTVDVYIEGDLALDNFAYRTATNFGDVPAGVPLQVGIALANSTSVNDTLVNFEVTFEADKTYYVIASGIVGSPTTPFTLLVYDNAREEAVNPDELDLLIHHGSPNAPAVDVNDALNGTGILSNVPYGAFSPYLSLAPDFYLFDIDVSSSNTNVGTWGGNLTALSGAAGLVFASGLVGDDFTLMLALPQGFVLELPSFSRVQVIHNAPAPTVDVYYDNSLLLDNFQFREATEVGFLPANTAFTLGVAPDNSTGSGQSIYTLPIPGLTTGRSYTIMAAGEVGSPTEPFQLYVNDNARFRANNPASVAINLFHGATDAPPVDVKLPGVGPVIFNDVAFGNFTNYLEVPPAPYLLDLTPANDNSNVLVTYRADVTALAGQALTTFASGFFTGGNTPEFGVWVALADGTTFPLPVVVSTNELDSKLESASLAPNPAVSEMLLNLNLNASEALRFAIRDVAGRMVQEGDLGTVNAGQFTQKINVGALPGGFYQLELRSDAGVRTLKFAVQR
jgi:hypothetical protein